MRYREHAPPAPLEPFVTCFWEITDGSRTHRVLPDGAMDLLFAAGDTGASVIGPMTRAIVTADAAPAWAVGVRFRPGAAVAMLDVSARELRDDRVDASDVWGRSGRILGERLAACCDQVSATAMMAAELVSRLGSIASPDARVVHAVETLKAAGGELPVPAVAAHVGLSERQLERLFDECVGYGPKTFARVVRLQRAVRIIAIGGGDRGTTASWASFARECGYADQAHLIREFKALTGVTPRVYARAVSEIDNPGIAPLATVSS